MTNPLFDHDEIDARTASLLLIAGRELAAAQGRFAKFNSPHEGWSIIHEELDELWAHVRANTGTGQEAFTEAIQVAAMALRYAYELTTVSAYEIATGGDGEYDWNAARWIEAGSRSAVEEARGA